MSDAMELYVEREIRAKMLRDEETIRSLLGRWVSEMEPAVAYEDGEVIGLCVAGAPVGTTPFILRAHEQSKDAKP